MSIHNLKDYKLSKYLVRDLTTILRLLKQFEKQLSYYNKYQPVQSLLHKIKEQKGIVKFHLEKQSRILEDKGLEEENNNEK